MDGRFFVLKGSNSIIVKLVYVFSSLIFFWKQSLISLIIFVSGNFDTKQMNNNEHFYTNEFTYSIISKHSYISFISSIKEN